ncbi:MAG: dTDP-4-dehydrorhamnose 3,5-epimerase [Gammaproteobacteria bacterium]
MKFTPTRVDGAYLIGLERIEDERGFFARAWCAKEFAAHGLNTRIAQANVSGNKRKGILRGLHYQTTPHEEAKLMRCTRGAIFDVCLDLRPGSRTYRQWEGVELSAETGRMLYIPEGCAHGYQILMDDTEVFYQASQFYAPDAERGVRWDDPAFGIEWPLRQGLIITDKDQSWPDYTV